MTELIPCPICGAPEPRWERYPNMVCVKCAALAEDEQGRRMRFSNESILGTGFVAEVVQDGVWRRVGDDGRCVVKGRRCIAREHRFGGIVVQTVEPDGSVR